MPERPSRIERLNAQELARKLGQHGRELSERPLGDYARKATTEASGRGRQAGVDSIPREPSRVYASAILDRGTCPPCFSNDGTEYGSVEESLEDFPAGGYVNCEGGERCRCTRVFVWGDEAEPTAPAPGDVAPPPPGEPGGGPFPGQEPLKRGDARRPGAPTLESVVERAGTTEATWERAATLDVDKWAAQEAKGRAPWQLPKDDFVRSTPKGFRYAGDRSFVANANDPKAIQVSDKFFELEPELRRHVIQHELGHELVDSLSADGLLFDLADRGAFGIVDEMGRPVAGLGTGNSFEEITTEAYAALFSPVDAAMVRERYPELVEVIEERAKAMGMPLPPISPGG